MPERASRRVDGAAAIEARDVCVKRGARTVLEGVGFSAARGSVTAILGPNGAGKSSLLKAIAGLLPFDGEIGVLGRAIAPLDPRQRARLLAYVPQQTQLRAPMSVWDVVGLARYAFGGELGGHDRAFGAAVESALRDANVLALRERVFTALSGGEQRRVLIARALASGAPVLLLDEPSASLDVRHALELFALCRELASKGYAVVMVLHQLADALRCADQVLLLHEGRGVALGAPDEVIVDARVREVYGVSMIPTAAPAFELHIQAGES